MKRTGLYNTPVRYRIRIINHFNNLLDVCLPTEMKLTCYTKLLTGSKGTGFHVRGCIATTRLWGFAINKTLIDRRNTMSILNGSLNISWDRSTELLKQFNSDLRYLINLYTLSLVLYFLVRLIFKPAVKYVQLNLCFGRCGWWCLVSINYELAWKVIICSRTYVVSLAVRSSLAVERKLLLQY